MVPQESQKGADLCLYYGVSHVFIIPLLNRKYLAGEILANHAGKSYQQRKIWWISNSRCIYHICFLCICEYWQGKFSRMAHDLPNFPIFSLPKFSLYSITVCWHHDYHLWTICSIYVFMLAIIKLITTTVVTYSYLLIKNRRCSWGKRELKTRPWPTQSKEYSYCTER